jgi:hypothetical protein
MLQPSTVDEQRKMTKNESSTRKKYTKPGIIHEVELETRAGSPLKIDPLEPGTWNPFES